MANAEEMVAAVNRLADSQFEQAKAMRRSAKAQESAVLISNQMMEMQKANLAVTSQLEQLMIAQREAASA